MTGGGVTHWYYYGEATWAGTGPTLAPYTVLVYGNGVIRTGTGYVWLY